MLQFAHFLIRGFRPRRAVPAAHIRSFGGTSCARLEARSLPCCCRDKAVLVRLQAAPMPAHSQPARQRDAGLGGVLADPHAALGGLLEHHSLQALGFSTIASAFGEFSRRIPAQQQVFRSAGGLSIARREPAGRVYFRPAMPSLPRNSGRRAPDTAETQAQSKGRGKPSNSQESDRGGSCADARLCRGSEQARETPALSGDHREHRPVCRTLRHGRRDHDGVPGDRRDRLDESERGRPWHRRCIDRDGGRARGGHSRSRCSTTI